MPFHRWYRSWMKQQISARTRMTYFMHCHSAKRLHNWFIEPSSVVWPLQIITDSRELWASGLHQPKAGKNTSPPLPRIQASIQIDWIPQEIQNNAFISKVLQEVAFSGDDESNHHQEVEPLEKATLAKCAVVTLKGVVGHHKVFHNTLAVAPWCLQGLPPYQYRNTKVAFRRIDTKKVHQLLGLDVVVLNECLNGVFVSFSERTCLQSWRNQLAISKPFSSRRYAQYDRICKIEVQRNSSGT